MKYFIENQELENQIKEIRKKIRLSMNGVVSDAMKDYGFSYKQNFGVQIPRLKEIASSYTPHHNLAQRLWALKIRETMILASLLQPAESFSLQNANEWIESIDNIELAEQACMNLFAKLPFAKVWSSELRSSNSQWKQITGFILITRIRESIEYQEIDEISNRAIQLLNTDNFHLYKSIAVCLARLCRNGKQTASLIQAKIAALSASEKVGQRYVYNEIENELSFLDF